MVEFSVAFGIMFVVLVIGMTSLLGLTALLIATYVKVEEKFGTSAADVLVGLIILVIISFIFALITVSGGAPQ